MTDYTDFVTTKLRAVPPVGITRQVDLIDGLFPHQIDLVRWALRRGRAAIFADTGLGKTRMQVAWADVVHRETGGDLLILAPLAVAQQTVAEAAACGVTITHAHDASEIRPGINITNYDRLHKFDTARFVGVVLDESSVIKHHTSKTLQALLDAFSRTPYRLCATATPAPNDWTELGTHAEFLGIRSRAEMLAEVFTAADMATAAAQGFRDGVASVAAHAGSEPVAPEWDEVFDCAAAAWCRSSTSHDMLRMCFQSRNQTSHIAIGWTANDLMDFAKGIARIYTHPSPPEGMVGGWISVEDRLPKLYTEVLIHPRPTAYCCEGEVDTQGRWSYGEYETGFGHHQIACEVTHWMPLPPPPTTSAGSGKGE